MTIAYFKAEDLDLCFVTFEGVTTLAELLDHARHRDRDRRLVECDTLHLIGADTNFVDLDEANMKVLRDAHVGLLKAAPLPVVRRTAWICDSPSAMVVIRKWLHGRGGDDGFYASPRIVETFSEAAEWLAIPPARRAPLARGEGLRFIARTSPALAR